MGSFFKTLALGFGLALGGGTAYALITSETARLYIFSFGGFILGAVIVGLAIIYSNRTLLQGLFGRERRETTNVNYRFPQHPLDRPGSLPSPTPWDATYPRALPPPVTWPPSNETGGNSNYVPRPPDEDEFIA